MYSPDQEMCKKGEDVFSNNILDICKETYFRRLGRQTQPPIFVVASKHQQFMRENADYSKGQLMELLRLPIPYPVVVASEHKLDFVSMPNREFIHIDRPVLSNGIQLARFVYDRSNILHGDFSVNTDTTPIHTKMNILKKLFGRFSKRNAEKRGKKQPTLTVLIAFNQQKTKKEDAEKLLAEQCAKLAALNPQTAVVAYKDDKEYQTIFKAYLPSLFETDFVLVMQADGKMVSEWTDEFFQYDYVGVPWMKPWVNDSLAKRGKDPKNLDLHVGSGKLSLRSRALCDAVKQRNETKPDKLVEDSSICLENRSFYESQGIKFAPYELAAKFAAK